MKFGVREICEVVLKAKAKQTIGNKTFYKGEPVIYFDTLKTSSLEGAATTVYAQGGRGNSRLVAWEGERTLTFTMEDALISPAGFMILSGAGLIEGTAEKPIQVHVSETTDAVTYVAATDDVAAKAVITLKETPSVVAGASIYVMVMKDGEVVTEPFLAKAGTGKTVEIGEGLIKGYVPTDLDQYFKDDGVDGSEVVVMVDYYTDKSKGAQQIEITPDKFGGNFYLEASTLFRQTNGVDMPAEFIIPNCKIQSNFTFTMASSGDPSTFTFTMDAFPDYTRFDNTKKVLAAIQVIEDTSKETSDVRTSTEA